jgi:hypothetical protein
LVGACRFFVVTRSNIVYYEDPREYQVNSPPKGEVPITDRTDIRKLSQSDASALLRAR